MTTTTLKREPSALSMKLRLGLDTVSAGLQRVSSGLKQTLIRLNSKEERVSGLIVKSQLGELQRVNDYEIQEVIGTGSHSTVYLATHTTTNKPYAIKAVTYHLRKQEKRSRWARGPIGAGGGPQTDTPKQETYAPETMLAREIAIMKKLEHQNVVKLYEAIEDFDTKEVFLVMEYIEQGAVMPESMHVDPFDLDTSRRYFRQLITALEYCHAHGVIHCDIKPANLLLQGNEIKVADFGTSRLMGEHRPDPTDEDKVVITGQALYVDETVSKVMGTSAFLSPQAHSGDRFSGVQNDIWSAGVTLYFFVFGKCPFEGESILDVHENVIEMPLEFPEEPAIPDSLRDLMMRLMAKGEEQRISIKQIKNHPWVTCDGKDPMAAQEFTPIEVTEEDCEQAFQTHRQHVPKLAPRGPLLRLGSRIKSTTPSTATPRPKATSPIVTQRRAPNTPSTNRTLPSTARSTQSTPRITTQPPSSRTPKEAARPMGRARVTIPREK